MLSRVSFFAQPGASPPRAASPPLALPPRMQSYVVKEEKARIKYGNLLLATPGEGALRVLCVVMLMPPRRV